MTITKNRSYTKRSITSLLLLSGILFSLSIGELSADNTVRVVPKKRLILNKTPKNTPADLKVMSVSITPQPPRAKKDLINIKVMVRNVGGRPTPMPASLSMSVYSVDASGNRTNGDSNLNAIPWYTNNIPVLNPGESREISKTVTCNHPGPHEVSGVIITEGFAVGDELSQNNSYKESFSVHFPPKQSDIELTKFRIDSSGHLEIRMTNRGFSIPERDFEYSQVRVYVNDDPYKTLVFPEVDPTGIVKKGRGNGPIPIGPIKYLTYKWPSTGTQGLQFNSGQTYTIKVHLNYNNSIYDKKLNNNSKTKTVTAP